MNDSHTILTVDIGGTFTRAAIMCSPERIMARAVAPTLQNGTDALCQTILSLKRQTEAACSLSVSGIAIAIACIVEPKGWLVRTSLKFGITRPVDLRELIHAATSVPVIVRTELSMSALGEIVGERRHFTRNLVVLTAGTGMGAGIILEGHLHLGSTGCAGEIGHIQVVSSSRGRPCSCGRKGCLEPYAASRSVTRIVGAGPWHTPEEAVSAARSGNARAIRALRRTGRYLGLAASLCVNAYDPEVVVLRGGFVRAIWPFVSSDICKSFSERALRPDTPVKLSDLGDDGVLLGLRAAWVESIGTMGT